MVRDNINTRNIKELCPPILDQKSNYYLEQFQKYQS